MKYIAHVTVMPLQELLDPQGKATKGGLHNLGLSQIADVRVGKHITLTINAASQEEAEEMAEKSCKQLLVNEVMESYTIEVKEA